MSHPHWEYFLSIESDLAQCTRYVEFAQDNFRTYSVEFARIIVAAAAEFDAVAKALCREVQPGSSPERITDYHPIISAKYPRFCEYKIHIPRFKLSIEPWRGWTANASPEWWSKGYNKIKHHRDQHFESATLHNAIYATAGLLTGIVYLYDSKYGEFPNMELAAGPKLLEPQNDPSGYEPSSVFWTCEAWK